MKRRGGGLLVLQREYGGCRSSAAGEIFLGIPDRPGLVSCSLVVTCLWIGNLQMRSSTAAAALSRDEITRQTASIEAL